MPTFNDYDKDEESQGGAGGGSHGGGGGGAELAAPSAQKETGFVPWSRFVSANEDVSKRNANSLNSQVQGEISGAQDASKKATNAFNAGIESNYDQHRTSDIPLNQRPTFQMGGAVGEFGKPPAQAQGAGFSGFGSKGGAEAVQPKAPAQQVYGQTSSFPTFGGLGTKGGMPGIDKAPSADPALRTLSQNAITNGPQGAKDLESSMGPDAWAKLMGDTTKAQADAGALGSQSGVQALIQKQAGAPLAQNGAFDAALVNGQGSRQFGETAKAGAGLSNALTGANQTSQGAWHSLMGDINETRRQRASTAEAAAANARPAAAPAAAPGAAPTQPTGDTSGWSAGDDEKLRAYTSLGQNAADRNNGQVVQNFGSQDSGWDQGAFQSDNPSINVPINPKTKKPDYQAWWGGAGGPDVGDQSIDAATWYALAQMPPDQRAAWWKHNHPGAK